MSPSTDRPTAARATEQDADLTWLFHRSAQTLRTRFDEVARSHGLNDARDWVILTLVHREPGRQQRELADASGFDKTTLMSMIDRLQRAGLVERTPDPRDRRSRIPVVTPKGEQVQQQVVAARDRAEAELLGPFTPEEQALLRRVLWRLATGGPPAGATCTGSEE